MFNVAVAFIVLSYNYFLSMYQNHKNKQIDQKKISFPTFDVLKDLVPVVVN